jgi:hypothetical protein
MKKIIKIIGFIFLFFTILYIAIGIYISQHEKEFLAEFTQLTNEKIEGEIEIKDLSINFLKNFPYITIQLHNVTLKDHNWKNHQKTLLQASSINSKLFPWDILRKKINIKNINVKDANLIVFTDINGYSNISALKLKNATTTHKSDKSLFSIKFNQISIENSICKLEKELKHKDMHFVLKKVTCKIEDFNSVWNSTIDLNLKVENMIFNSTNGSFLHQKEIKSKLLLTFYPEKELIQISSNKLQIGNEKFSVKSEFNISEQSQNFSIHLDNPSIRWKNANELLSNNIKEKLKKFDFNLPIKVSCTINGNLKKPGTPIIKVNAESINNILTFEKEKIKNFSFNGYYFNNYNKNEQTTDQNSVVFFSDMKGNYKNIPFTLSNTKLLDLKNTVATGNIKVTSSMSNFNSIFEEKTIQFNSGMLMANINFKENLKNLKINQPELNGTFSIKNAEMIHIHSNTKINDLDLDLKFLPNQMVVKNLNFKRNLSQINLKGETNNYLNLFYQDTEKINLNCRINSTYFDIEDFNFLFFNKNKIPSKRIKSKSNAIEDVFTKFNFNIDLKANKIIYKNFESFNGIASITYNNNNLKFQKVSLNFGKGTFSLLGELSHQVDLNKFNARINIKNIELNQLLYSFNNFGSSSIKNNTIYGLTNLSTQLSGTFSNDGKLDIQSMNGFVDFDVKNGMFNHFEPIVSIGKIIFPNRNFKEVKFETIQGHAVVKNGKFLLDKIPINSNLLYLDLEGIYGFKDGTNMDIDVHLRNPEKDKKYLNPEILKQNREKGIIVHLNAIEDQDGKLKIKIRKKNKN